MILVFASLAASAQRQPLSRYQSIIDRHMFGLPPPGFDPDKNPNDVKGGKNAEKQLTAEQEKIQSSIRFSMINITPSGETAVGFTDKSDPKSEVHYYLKVGETRNGWTVKEADPVRAWMRIAKGDIEVELELGGDSAKGGATTKMETTAAKAEPAKSAKPGSPPNALLNSGGLRAKRRFREQREAEREAKMEEARKQLEEERAAMREELALHREEIALQREEFEQREALRKAEEEERRERGRREEDERRQEPKEGEIQE